MSIRYECDQCGSVLKIKDDLAGKPGKCPKCKTAFTVPVGDSGVDSSTEIAVTKPSGDAESELSENSDLNSSGDFDVDAYLSGDDGSERPSKPKAPSKPRATVGIDADRSLDESDDESKPIRSKPRSGEEDSEETFQIRRGPDAPGKAGRFDELEDDDADEQSNASRRPPGTNPNAPAANIASDLLSKSAKKGKKTNWNEPEPGKNEEPGFDWDGLWYETRTKLLPVVGGGAAFCLLVYVLIFPMFGGKSYVPKLGTVSGVISVNGKPLAGAHVLFHPVERKQESKGKQFNVTASVGQSDATGRYELMYGEIKGAIIGKCRIEIMCTDYTGINPKYFSPKGTPATAEVKPGQQIINLELSE